MAYDLTVHPEWVREMSIFSVLKRVKMFKKRALFQVQRVAFYAGSLSRSAFELPGAQRDSYSNILTTNQTTAPPAFQAFRQWQAAVRSTRFTRRQQQLSRSLLTLSPAYGKVSTRPAARSLNIE